MRENSTFSNGTRISVVDDDESMREATKALIGSMGLSVEAEIVLVKRSKYQRGRLTSKFLASIRKPS